MRRGVARHPARSIVRQAATLVVVFACCSVPGAARAQDVASGAFEHTRHASLSCDDCHGNARATSTVDRSWCADCHHESVRITECTRCHVTSEVTPEPRRTLLTFNLEVAAAKTRSVVFDHARHDELACSDCHAGGGPGMEAQTECTDCHERHHQPAVTCSSCHAEPLVTAHAPEMHLDLAGCGGAGCHAAEGIDYERLSGERTLCLACHVAQEDHERGSECLECHIMGGEGSPGRRDR